VLARPIFIIFIPVDRLRSFPVLPHQQHSPSDGVQASIREKWFTRFPSMYRLGVTNSKKAYTSFLPASISAGFLHFDTAWRRLSYTLYDFLHRATSPDILIGLYKNHLSESRLAQNHFLASEGYFFSFPFLVFIIDLRKKERRFWCVGFFELLSVVQMGTNLATSRVGGDKKRKGTFFYPSCFFLSECWLYLHNNVGFFLASFLH
jgi:hypothetical protein